MFPLSLLFQLGRLKALSLCDQFLGYMPSSLTMGLSFGDRLPKPFDPLGQVGDQGLTPIQAWTQQSVQAVVHALQAFWMQLHHLFDIGAQQIQAFGDTIATVAIAPTLWQVGLYWLLLLVMLVGFIGSFVPILPGVALVLLAVIIWGVVTGFSGIGWSLGVAIAAFLLSILVDNLAGLIGAQKAGASRWSQIGALVGMAVGFLVLTTTIPVVGPVLGIILGTMLGAIVGEFLHRRNLEFLPRAQQSFKVGLAILVGSLVGNLLQGLLALIAIVVFISDTWSTVYG